MTARDETFGKSKSKYFICLHCERAYKNGEFRLVDGLEMCPYEDCDGDTVIDAWEWEFVREGNPSYPENPELNKVYPING